MKLSAARMALRIPLLLAVLLSGCDEGTAPPWDGVTFAAPVVGAPMVDVFYGAYLDQASTGPARDYACGSKAYENHRGVDILLRNFTVQDTGVTVVAAAPGVVSVAVDGHPDRNTEWIAGGFGNYVVVDHDGDVRTVYAHLRRESVAVETGQQVAVGSLLGLVGSSGFSNWPHLHFEVWVSGAVVDPFEGSCGSSSSMWTEQLPYQDELMVTDAGLLDLDSLSRAILLERPPSLTHIPLDAVSFRFWFQVANQRASHVRVEVHGPGAGEPAHTATGDVRPTFSMTYVSTEVPVAGVLTEPGDWEIRVYHDQALTWTHPFEVVEADGSAAIQGIPGVPELDTSLQVHPQAPPPRPRR